MGKAFLVFGLNRTQGENENNMAVADHEMPSEELEKDGYFKLNSAFRFQFPIPHQAAY